MATFVSDTFTDTDNTNLSAHTGETGATWAKHTSYTADATIISNQAKVSSGTAMYYASGNPTNADYYAAMDIIRSGSGALGVACRVNTAAHTFYYAQHYTNWQLYKAVAGTHTQLGSTVFPQFSAFDAKIMIEREVLAEEEFIRREFQKFGLSPEVQV